MNTRVVLDANAYCETNYARSGKFDSLLDYLKRSNARLVLLPSVLVEVLAKHDRDFRAQIQAAENSVKEAAKYCFTGKHPRLLGAHPDFALETEALKQRLLNVGKWVGVDYLPDCTGVDILEVARRGARRIPPANSNGEELRDVIHWLMIMSYAKQNDARVLFVTRDNGFWERGGGAREEILKEVAENGQRIELFRDIDDLLKQNSLSSVVLDANRAVDLFDLSRVEAAIVEIVGNDLNGVETSQSLVDFKSGRLVSSNFQTGTIYLVSTDSEFVEATFRVSVIAQIEFKPKLSAYFELGRNAMGGRSVPLSSLSGGERSAVPFEITAFVDLSTRVVENQAGTPEVERVRLDFEGGG